MHLRSSEERLQSPLPSIVLDVLFGSGIVLFLLAFVYMLASPGVSTFHVTSVTACYAVLALVLGVAVSSPCSSTFGTPLLNKYRRLSKYWIGINALLMLTGALLIYSTPAHHLAQVLLWTLVSWGILTSLSCLLLIRGMSSAIRRQRKFPRLMGCSFLFIGPDNETSRHVEAFSGREGRGIFLSFFNPSGSEENDLPELQRIIETRFVEKAVFLDPDSQTHLIGRCKLQGIEVWTPPAESPSKAILDQFHVDRTTPAGSIIQFAFNRLASVVLIVASLPLWLIAAVGIRLADKGPVFYQQNRSGLYGKHFGMWKFRTMYTDADKRLDEIKALYGNDMAGPIFKLKNDPRIFPFGKILRMLSIDELPQLVNTLLGEMNIVGPRPLPVYETEAFDRIEQRKRLCVLPGLTCYWQIEGRSNITDFNELVALDDKYINNRSLWLDVKLIVKTIPAVLLARGAE